MRTNLLCKLPFSFGLAALVAFAVSAPGCSYATNETAVQCTSEAECLAKGPEFAGTTCDVATKTCIRLPENTDLCKTNQECIDQAGGAPATCRKRDHKCVSLTTTECPNVLAQPTQLLDDNAIVIGAVSPLGAGEVAPFFENAMRLAQKEISAQVKGLPPVSGSSAARPLIIVSCREITTAGTPGLLRAVNHLVDDLDVPVVLGPIDASNQVIAQTQVLRPKKVMSILPLGYVDLNSLPNPFAPKPASWSLSQNDAATAKVVSAFITKELEPKLRAAGITDPIRVAMLFTDNVLGQSSAPVFESALTFNSMTAVQNANASPPNYLKVNLGDPVDFVANPAPEQKFAAAVTAVQKFKPHIVLHLYTPLAIAKVFIPFASTWAPVTMNAPVPYTIDIGTGNFAQFPALLDFLARPTSVPWRTKIFSTATHRSAARLATVDEWILKFKTEFPDTVDSSVPSFYNVHGWYDAAYVAAYALAAVGSKPLTGENVAATLPLLSPPGMSIGTGTKDISKAFGLLAGGQGVDLEGLAGNLNLDPRTGQPTYDVEMVCPPAPVAGKIGNFRPSGFYSEDGIVTGTATCPPP